MTDVRLLRAWLEQFDDDDDVYAAQAQGFDDGIWVITKTRARFLHAAEADLNVKTAKDRLTAHERAEWARRAQERRYEGD